MSLEDNCGKFGRTKMIFFMTLPGGLVLCLPGQYRVFPPLATIIAASRRGILATRRWRRCTGICAYLSSRAWRSSSRFWGGLSIDLIVQPNSSRRCSMGLQSGDLGGCSIFVTLPCCRKSRTTLARWGVLYNAPIEHTGEISIREHKRGFGSIVESSPYVDRTTTSLDPMSLAPWPEALTR